jgi:hypothetical protein
MDFRMLGLLAFVWNAPLVGCDDTGSATVDGGASDGAPQDGAVVSQDASPDAAIPSLDCATYCSEIQAHCTGENAQYPDMQTCLASCASFDVGVSSVTDTSGNTLGCRIYHGGDPAKMDPETECLQAGPAGAGAQIPDGGPPSGCSGGDVCLSFCALEIKACGSQDAPLPGDPKDSIFNPLYQYRNSTSCLDHCDQEVDKTHAYSTNAVGDSLACRLKEATLAAVSIESAKMHCLNTAAPPIGPCAGTASP